jgi:hypothetical protein
MAVSPKYTTESGYECGIFLVKDHLRIYKPKSIGKSRKNSNRPRGDVKKSNKKRKNRRKNKELANIYDPEKEDFEL